MATGKTNNDVAKLTRCNTNANNVVDLNDYVFGTNYFVFPNDGYVYANSLTNTTGRIRVVIRSPNNVAQPCIFMNITGNYQVQSLFVKKGMEAAVVSGNVANCEVKYFPLDM